VLTKHDANLKILMGGGKEKETIRFASSGNPPDFFPGFSILLMSAIFHHSPALIVASSASSFSSPSGCNV